MSRSPNDTKNRIDNAHNVKYPPLPDARGSARVNYRRKPVYLGPHESALSHVMFGIWKHQLAISGEPPETASVRQAAESLLVRELPPARKFWQSRLAFSVLASTLILSTATLLAAKIVSSRVVPTVDDIALTATELDVVRGFRMAEAAALETRLVRSEAIGHLASQFVDRGSLSGKMHNSKEDF